MSGSHDNGSPRDESSAREASSPRDASSVVDVVRSLDTRLDDLRRETSWRAIEGAIDERPAITPAPQRTWRLPVFALATIAVIIALVVLPKPTREGSNANSANANSASNANASNANSASASNGGGSNTSDASDPPTALSASAGQRTVFERDGIVLTLVGPSVATVHREANLVRVTVTKGLVVADRTPSAPALAVDAGDNHVVSRDARFAVRVEPTMVVLGAGEQARQIVERHAIDLGALPLDSVPMPSTAPTSPTESPQTTSAKSNATSTTSAKSNVRLNSDDSTKRTPPKLPDLRLDAAELYKRAEAALAVRDSSGAREFLERLLREYPTDSRVDAARYDLALIARSNSQHQRALELLDALIATGTDENLVGAARRLRPTLSSP